MTFLNGLLAFGALATLLPLAIHLLNRQRFETIDWAAMHLIAAVHRVNQRRWRWQELLLLLVRCAIPVLLALALARPVLTAWRAAGGDQPATTIVLLDDSASMQRAMPDGGSVFDEARRRIARALQTAAGSEANIVLSGGVFEPLADVPTNDLEGLLEQLGQRQPTAGTLDLRGATQAALEQLAAAKNPWRRLVVVSDFSAEDWQNADSDIASSLESVFGDAPGRPEVTLIPLRPDGTESNIAVTTLQPDATRPVVDQQVRFTATVASSADAAASIKGHWSVDGTRHDSAQLAIEPNGLVSVERDLMFSQPGTHRVRFEIETDDALAFDDSRDWVVFVDSPTQVLLVDGKPSAEPLAGEADYLSIALSPFALARDERVDVASARVVTAGEVDADALAAVDTIVLANVRELDQQRTELLVDFVAAGGHVAIFLGDHVSVDWYNRLFERGDEEPVLPIRLESAEDAEPPLGLEFVRSTEEIQPLVEMGGEQLEQVEVRRFHGLAWADSDAGGRVSGEVLLRLSGGQPYLVRHRWKNGVITLCAGPADADWANLPMRPVFLPLVQHLLGRRTLGLERTLNTPSGNSLVDLFPRNAGEAFANAEVVSAAGNAVEANVDAVGRYARVRTPRLRYAANYVMQYGEAPRHDATVFVPATESAADPLSDSQLQTLADAWGGTVVADAEAMEARNVERRFGREIWHWLLAVAVFLLLFEMFWQQRIRRAHRLVGSAR